MQPAGRGTEALVWRVDLAKPPMMGLPPLEMEPSSTEGGSESVFGEEAVFQDTFSQSPWVEFYIKVTQ